MVKVMFKVYLADLVYDTIKANYTVPLNISSIAASLKMRYREEVEITLFKYPKALEKAIRNSPPDILGLSHYSWNSRLNTLFLRMVKRIIPKAITVMGGPNIRTEPHGIKALLTTNPDLDYYILHEGEAPFADLASKLLEGNPRPQVPGAATLIGDEFVFEPIKYNKKRKEIDLPSPYLSGLLDPFLADADMIPLLETNRGCPFGCIYCAWGIATLSNVRVRPLEMVLEEIDYIGRRSVGQVNWIICDANFGILPRDIDIAVKLAEARKRKGFPASVQMWYSKNTSARNIEIAEILGQVNGTSIAIQSSDPTVLNCIGRGRIRIDEIKKQIHYCKARNLEVQTDILIGLPEETPESHLNSLIDAFDMGFDLIQPYNIRMLYGSKYESDAYREKYEIKTKYRPIFGAYGIYDERVVFEVEESVRATKNMSEEELNNLKVLHWLIYFAWNSGVFKPILRFGQQYDINPVSILSKLTATNQPFIKAFFERMRNESMREWFNSSQEMLSFYEKKEHFDSMVKDFVKLNALYIALAYNDADIIRFLQNELVRIVEEEIAHKCSSNADIMRSLVTLSDQMICKDLLQGESSIAFSCPSGIAAIALKKTMIFDRAEVMVEIYRPKEIVSLCHYHLVSDGKRDFSLQNFTRFLEAGGMGALLNKIRIAGTDR